MTEFKAQHDGLLILAGVFFLFLAVVGTCSGKAWARGGRVVYRAKEAKEFWWLTFAIAVDLALDEFRGGHCLVDVDFGVCGST